MTALRLPGRVRTLVALAALLGVTSGAAATPLAAPGSATAKQELPELPRVPSLELKDPTPADLAEVDDLLDRIAGEDAAQREDGVRRIAELAPRVVLALRRRLEGVATRADKDAMKRLLGDIRRKAKGDSDEEPDPKDAASQDRATDYLDFVLKQPRPKDEAWRALVRTLALRRMLETLGTTPAVRGIVEVYVRFGDFLRVDTQRSLARLGDKAVPALLEARRYPAEKIARWATRQLDGLGRVTPGQAAQIADPLVLADVLRAYGRTRDLDAARIVVSFAGSERGQLREGARQAIAMFGEAGHWQLKDAYENVVGKRAARDWTWERTARELFGALDRLRREEVIDRFEAGKKAEAAGDLDKMRAAYDDVLSRAPFFERAGEMIAGYLRYADKVAPERPDDAILALRRAERLSRTAPNHSKIESKLLTLEAERLSARAIADKSLLGRALELDPENARARDVQARIALPQSSGDHKLCYSIAGGIAALGLAGVLFVLLRPRGKLERPADSGLPPADSSGG
jgi:hypothetical protein